MRVVSASTFYVFLSFAALVMVVVVRPTRVTGDHLSEDAPTQFVIMADNLQSSPVASALDPRVDVQNDVSHDPVTDPVEPLGAAQAESAAPHSGSPGDAEPVAEARSTAA